ncbi:MAG: tRNA (adenosine(37)-N6)-dimethylallyltransferase MiaA [Eubacterium sp.]|nr:tRNA (adenosine(37)-N6)-dimethylallyltransferase MiaA [Eubacterium sp.]
MMKKKLVIITGPTAVGKTELSIRLAKAIDGEIISADSIQVYKGMNIGSAKITPEEMQGVPHYLIDELTPDQEFNVHQFQLLTKQYMDRIYTKNKIPIIVGGTGFYIQSVLYDIQFDATEENHEYRDFLEAEAAKDGGKALYEKLKEIDPASCETIHANNVKRVIRALEYYHETGKKISEHNEEQRQNESPYQFCYFVLNTDRQILYDRINQRVNLMVEQGLEGEVQKLLEQGYAETLPSMQGIGYKEMIAYLKGECSLEEAIYQIKLNTRHFAKRQLTWFRREKEVTMVDYLQFQNDKNQILDYMLTCLKERGII